MTDRVNALLVHLEQDIREDDVQGLVGAILWMRYVQKVELNVTDYNQRLAEERARMDL